MDSFSEDDDDNSNHSAVIDREVAMAMETVRREQEHRNNPNSQSEDSSTDGESRESPLRTASNCTTASSSSSCSIQPKRRGSHRPPPPVTIPPGMQNNVLKKRERNSTTTSSSVIAPIAPPPQQHQPNKSKMKLQQQIAQAVQSAKVDKKLARFNESFRFADGCGGIFPIPDDLAKKSSKNQEGYAEGGYTSDNSIELFPSGSTSNKVKEGKVQKSAHKEELESSQPKFQSSFVSLTDTTVDMEHDNPAPKSSTKRNTRTEDATQSRRKVPKDEPTSKNTKGISRVRSEKEPKSATKKSSSSKDRSEKEPKSPTKKSAKDRTEKEHKSPSKKSSSSKDRVKKEAESPRTTTRSSKDETTKEPKSPKKSSSRDRTKKETESPKESSSKDLREKESKSPKRKSTSNAKNNDLGEDKVDSPKKTKDRGEKEFKSSTTKKSSSRSDDVKEPKSPKRSSKDGGNKESKSSSRKSSSKDRVDNKDPDSARKSSSKRRSSDGSKSPKKRGTSDESKSPKKRETKENTKNQTEQGNFPTDEHPYENGANTSATRSKNQEKGLANKKEASFKIYSIQEKAKGDSQVSSDLLASLTSGSFWDVVDDVKKQPSTPEKKTSTATSIEEKRQISPKNEEEVPASAVSDSQAKHKAQGPLAKKKGGVLNIEDIYKFEQDDDSSEISEAVSSPIQETSPTKTIWIKLENENPKDTNDNENKKALEKKFIALKNKFVDSDSSDSDDSDSSDDSSTFVREAAKQCAKHHEELSQLSKRACQDDSLEADQSKQSSNTGVTMINIEPEAENMSRSSQEDHVDPLVVVESLAKVIDDKSKNVAHEKESESDSSESYTGDSGVVSHGGWFMSSYEEQRKEIAMRRSPTRVQSKSLANSSSIEERKKFLAELNSATSNSLSSPSKECDSPKKSRNSATASRFQHLQELAKQNSILKETTTETSSKSVGPLLPDPTSPSTPRKMGSRFEELRRKAMGEGEKSTVNNSTSSPLRVQPVANFKELRQKMQGIPHKVKELNPSIAQLSSVRGTCSPESKVSGVNTKMKASCKSDECDVLNENNGKSFFPLTNRKQEQNSESDSVSVSLQNATSLKDRKSSLFLQVSNQALSASVHRAQEAKSSNFANLRKIAMLAPDDNVQKECSGTKENETQNITFSESAAAQKSTAHQMCAEDRIISSKKTLKCNPENSSTSSQRAQEARSSNFAELRKQAMLVAKEVNHDKDCTSNTENNAGRAIASSKAWRGSVARQPSESLQNVTSLKDRMKFLEKKTSFEQKADCNQRCDEQALKPATEVQVRDNGVSGTISTNLDGRSGIRCQHQVPSFAVSSNLGKNTVPRTSQATLKMNTAATTSTANQTGQDTSVIF